MKRTAQLATFLTQVETIFAVNDKNANQHVRMPS